MLPEKCLIEMITETGVCLVFSAFCVYQYLAAKPEVEVNEKERTMPLIFMREDGETSHHEYG